MITPGERDLQKGFSCFPSWDGSFDVLGALVIDPLSQCVKNPKTMWRTQVGVQIKRDNNGDCWRGKSPLRIEAILTSPKGV